jgi:hypothetical protein
VLPFRVGFGCVKLLSECYKSVTRVLRECKSVMRMVSPLRFGMKFESWPHWFVTLDSDQICTKVSQGLRECYESITRVLLECYKSATGVLQDSFGTSAATCCAILL